MGNMACCLGCIGLLCIALTAGCAKPVTQASTDEEKSVREVFAEFQAALKARDADKLYSLLDSDSQADAERAAKAIREAYAKANAELKADQEKALGLPGDKLAALIGPDFLKTKLFHGTYDEVPDSKIDKVTIQGKTATVNYVEEDGDKKKFTLVFQQGKAFQEEKWKLYVPMPKPQ